MIRSYGNSIQNEHGSSVWLWQGLFSCLNSRKKKLCVDLLCTNTIIAVVWTWHMSLLLLDTRMVVQLLLSSCSLHRECECCWVSLWMDGNLCKNKCWCGWYWLMGMMQTLQHRGWRPQQGWFHCSAPVGLLSIYHQITFPCQDTCPLPDLCCGCAGLQSRAAAGTSQ